MPEKIDHLEIIQFVDEKEIDAVYYEKTYYLEPDKIGAKAYALLRDALTLEGKLDWVFLCITIKNGFAWSRQ